MAYQTTIPQPNDDLDVSVTDIQQNFLTANTVMDVNHYPFDNVTANKGKHKFVAMPKLAAAPATAAQDGTFYVKLDASSNAQFYYISDATTDEYQMTRTIPASFTSFGANAAYGVAPPSTVIVGGWTFLPGGMLLQYGKFTGTGPFNTPASGTIPFPVNFTGTPFTVQMTVVKDGGDGIANVSRTTAPTNTGFTYALDGSNYGGVYWWAIGV